VEVLSRLIIILLSDWVLIAVVIIPVRFWEPSIRLMMFAGCMLAYSIWQQRRDHRSGGGLPDRRTRLFLNFTGYRTKLGKRAFLLTKITAVSAALGTRAP
jgi:hypothetical protein